MEFISINKLSIILDTSVPTIKRWYKWYETTEDRQGLVLPEYYFLDARGTRYFNTDDLPVLQAFKKALNTTHKGAMSEFNAHYQWGTRGKKILENKGKA